IVAVDLNDDTIIPYFSDHHSDQALSRNSELKFRLSYPTNVFDPKPIGAFALSKRLDKASKTKTLMIVFAGPKFSNDFYPVEFGNGGASNREKVRLNNYEFIDSNFLSEDKYGKVS